MGCHTQRRQAVLFMDFLFEVMNSEEFMSSRRTVSVPKYVTAEKEIRKLFSVYLEDIVQIQSKMFLSLLTQAQEHKFSVLAVE